MRIHRSMVGLLFSAVLLSATSARAESTAEVFARGKASLAEGDLQAALKSYAAAARADRSNREYLSQYMLLRQAIEMRTRLETEKNPRRWEQLARSLHQFYVGQKMYTEVLALDRRVHARAKTASSAVSLAETELAMELNAEAVKTLSSVPSAKATASSQALLGIALLRQGDVQGAKQMAETVVLPEKTGPGTVYSVARLQAAVGNKDRTLQLLTLCFESVAPSRADGFKSHAKQSPDFAKLVSTAEFTKVLETKSKVSESACSGGSSCAGCPMRGNCGKTAGHGS